MKWKSEGKKIMIRVQFVFHYPSPPPIYKKIMGGVILQNIHPCIRQIDEQSMYGTRTYPEFG